METKDLTIYGGGGLGREIASLVNIINKSNDEPRYRLVGFFDDGKEIGTSVSHFGKVLGGIDVLNSWDSPLCVVIAIGNPRHIKNIVDKCSNPLIDFPNLIAPNTFIGDPETFSIGRGNVIQGGCAFTVNVSIGDFNLFNGSVVLGHDVKVGNFNAFMPDIRISGEVSIGDCNSLGVKSLVLQGISIGNNVTLGPGAVLLTRPKDNRTYLGNPAKLFKY